MPAFVPIPAAYPALNLMSTGFRSMQIDYAEFVEMLRNSA